MGGLESRAAKNRVCASVRGRSPGKPSHLSKPFFGGTEYRNRSAADRNRAARNTDALPGSRTRSANRRCDVGAGGRHAQSRLGGFKLMRPYYAIAALLFLAACGKNPAEKTVSANAAAIRVETVAVTETGWSALYESTGTVRARATAIVSSKLMGYAREVRAQIGDRVRGGQPLVVLDARDLETSVTRAEAGRQEVQSSLPEADSAIALARSQLDLAQLTFSRIKDL